MKKPTKKQLIDRILTMTPEAHAKKLGRLRLADLERELRRLERVPLAKVAGPLQPCKAVAIPVATIAPPIAPPIAALAPVIIHRDGVIKRALRGLMRAAAVMLAPALGMATTGGSHV